MSIDTTMLAATIGGSVAVLGSVLTAAVAVVTLRINKRSKDQELIIDALEFLGGGTQKRAAGIALAEHFGDNSQFRRLLLPVLQAQTIYLKGKLAEPPTPDEDRRLEQHNFERLTAVIESWTSRQRVYAEDAVRRIP